MNPLLHGANWGIIRGFHFLDPLGGLGIYYNRYDGDPIKGTPNCGRLPNDGKENGNYFIIGVTEGLQ